jgi:G3E family GTPase
MSFSGPIAAMFWLDEGLDSGLYIDGIVTLIDAKYGLQVHLAVLVVIAVDNCAGKTYTIHFIR